MKWSGVCNAVVITLTVRLMRKSNSSGTQLKSLTYDQSFKAVFCVGYQFSF